MEKIPKADLGRLVKIRDESLNFCDTVKKFHQKGAERLANLMTEKGEEHYTSDLGISILRSILSSSSYTKTFKSSVRQAVIALYGLLNDMPLKVRIPLKSYEYPGVIGKTAEEYLCYVKQELRFSDSTSRIHRYVLSNFAVRMDLEHISWNSLSYNEVIGFISSETNASPQTVGCLRRFLRYAFDKGDITEDLTLLLKSLKPHRKEKLPSYYSQDEVSQLEASVPRNTRIGKRDYAIMLLASRLGLRSSDIRKLQFGNLDWDKNEIKIRQYKTGMPLSLPLLADVGDAIIDYVKNGRAECRSKFIFLSMNQPYRSLSATAVSNIICKYFYKAGIEHKGKHTGAHALRHSLASFMLSEGTQLPVISETLGHESSESTMYYLGVDVDMLLKCSLEVPMVDDEFYKQRGGVLYE